MKKINRFEIYSGAAVNEALEVMATWPNRKEFENSTVESHLVNNMNGWLAEECFAETFKGWEYIDAEDHLYLNEYKFEERKGLPDFFITNGEEQFTAEVKTYKNYDKLIKKISWWRNHPEELHYADYVYVLIDNTWVSIDTCNDYKIKYECLTELPSWYKGPFQAI